MEILIWREGNPWKYKPKSQVFHTSILVYLNVMVSWLLGLGMGMWIC